MAFNRPLAGRVLVDGKDLNTLRLYDYRSQLGIVMQENFLFDGTVAQNIAFGTDRSFSTRDRIVDAGRFTLDAQRDLARVEVGARRTAMPQLDTSECSMGVDLVDHECVPVDVLVIPKRSCGVRLVV